MSPIVRFKIVILNTLLLTILFYADLGTHGAIRQFVLGDRTYITASIGALYLLGILLLVRQTFKPIKWNSEVSRAIYEHELRGFDLLSLTLVSMGFVGTLAGIYITIKGFGTITQEQESFFGFVNAIVAGLSTEIPATIAGAGLSMLLELNVWLVRSKFKRADITASYV